MGLKEDIEAAKDPRELHTVLLRHGLAERVTKSEWEDFEEELWDI